MSVDAVASVKSGSRNRGWSSRLSYIGAVIVRYSQLIYAYLMDASSVLDFLTVMRVRLSQSKISKLVCPNPIVPEIRLRSFGGAPVTVRSHTTDINVLSEIVVRNEYEALLRRHPPAKAEFIVDLGANTGLVDRWMAVRFPGAEIVAVEPEPGNAATLRRNVSGLPVKVVEAAIGAVPRTVRIHSYLGEFAFTMMGEPAPGAPYVEAPVVTLESVAGREREIDLLKVDIEGAEAELFGDCASWIGRVQMMIVECHGDYTLACLMADLRRGGADFEILEIDDKPGTDAEVGLLARSDRPRTASAA
jgi:FkbM family methyltransferase